MIIRFVAALGLMMTLVVGVLLGGERERATAPPAMHSEDEEAPPAPAGYSARHARLMQTGPDGKATYTVEAEALRQLPEEGTVEFDSVSLGFRDDGGNQWQAWGDHGSLGQESGQVELVGNVHVAGRLPGSQNQVHLRTERLHVDTQAQVVLTREPVTVSTSDQRSMLQGRGLSVDLKSGRLRLESEVHGTFLPQ